MEHYVKAVKSISTKSKLYCFCFSRNNNHLKNIIGAFVLFWIYLLKLRVKL
jgi:hypothetical protein